MTLERDYDLEEVAKALGMSTRWVRQQCADGAVHNRYGHKIKFTSDQVEMLRASFTKAPAPAVVQSITTGKRKAAKR